MTSVPDVETGGAFDCTLGIDISIVVFHEAHPIGHGASPSLFVAQRLMRPQPACGATTHQCRRNLKYLDRFNVRSPDQGVPEGTNWRRAKSGKRLILGWMDSRWGTRGGHEEWVGGGSLFGTGWFLLTGGGLGQRNL